MGYYKKNWMGKMEYVPDQPNNTETINIVDGSPVATSNNTTRTTRTTQNNPFTSSPQRTDVASSFLRNQRNADFWDSQANKYGFKSIDDVIAFQKKNGLKADGKVGKNTIAKIEELKGNNNSTTPAPGKNTSTTNSTQDVDTNSDFEQIAQQQRAEAQQNFMNNTYPSVILPYVRQKEDERFQETPLYQYMSAPTFDDRAKWRTEVILHNKPYYAFNNQLYRSGFSNANMRGRVRGYDEIETPLKAVGTQGLRKSYLTPYPNEDTSYYYQQGGTLNTKQQDKEEQLLQYALFSIIGANDDIDLNTAVSAIAEAYIKDPQSLTQVIQDENTIKQGMQKLEQENPGSVKQITQPGFMKKVISKLVSQKQQGIKQAKFGTKLDYIKQLKNICPEGYEIEFRKAGGTVCPVCKKKHKSKKAEQGEKIEKDCGGGISKAMDGIKADIKKVKSNKCGDKIRKHQEGSQISNNNDDEFSWWDLVPYVSTARQMKRTYDNPSAENVILSGVNLATDMLGGRAAVGALKAASKYGKIANKLRKAGFVSITNAAKPGAKQTWMRVGTNPNPMNFNTNIQFKSIPTPNWVSPIYGVAGQNIGNTLTMPFKQDEYDRQNNQ